MPLIVVFLTLMVGCAPMTEQVIYPDKITSLRTPPASDLTDNTMEAAIEAPIGKVWRALITVLSQHAFFTEVDGSIQNRKTVSFVDRTTLLVESKQEVVEMPFQVVIEAEDNGSTSITVICRWDLITTEEYRRTKKQRYEDLKKGMLIEAYILVNRVNVQSTLSERWQWLKEEPS